MPRHVPGAVICVVQREKPFPGAGTFAENADGQPVFLAEAVPPSPSPRENGWCSLLTAPLGPTLRLCRTAASSQLENGALRCVRCWMLQGRLGLAEPGTASESIREEPTEVTLSQQRRALSSWMSELPKCSTNLEHYWNKNSICRNFNRCKIIQAPNPSLPQHAMSSTLSQKNRGAPCSADRLLHN